MLKLGVVYYWTSVVNNSELQLGAWCEASVDDWIPSPMCLWLCQEFSQSVCFMNNFSPVFFFFFFFMSVFMWTHENPKNHHNINIEWNWFFLDHSYWSRLPVRPVCEPLKWWSVIMCHAVKCNETQGKPQIHNSQNDFVSFQNGQTLTK